jgi:large subunit ribosomal protein L29
MPKVREVRDLPDEMLIDQLETYKEDLFALRFQLATGQLDNPARIKQVRHDIARILTVLRERHLEETIERADEEALEKSREEQASGKKKGSDLGDAIRTSTPEREYEPTAEKALQHLEEGPDGE